jgi:hypothetical protein
MNKLFKLKEWLTIADASTHLTGVLNETVSEGDVLQLALTNRLKIAVYFANSVPVKKCKIVDKSEQCQKENFETVLIPMELDSDKTVIGMADASKSRIPLNTFERIKLNLNQTIEIREEILQIKGVYDLAMIGGEIISCETQYHLATGIEVRGKNIDGAFVYATDAITLYQIQDYFFLRLDSERQPSSNEQIRYYPAQTLPKDGMLVIKTSALRDFQDSLLQAQEKPLEKRERDNLLSIIAVLCEAAGFNYKTPAKTAEAIDNKAVELGIETSKRSIQDHLNKIPNALATRIK